MTPRQLSECRFVTGYRGVQPKPSRVADWILASIVGALGALALIHWWAS